MHFLFSLCAPLFGSFFSASIALLLVGIALITKHGVSVYAITFGFPTIIATISWLAERGSTKPALALKNILNVIIPLACMGAFIIHPVGQQAWAYTLYWLIPPLLLLVKNNTLNAAIRITFITHAVGSMLWVYTVQTTPEFWLALIPIVAFERFCFAITSATMVHGIKFIAQRYHHSTSSAKA